MLSLVRPRWFIPIHGERRHLQHHARLATEVGIPQDQVVVCEEDGEVMSVTAREVVIRADGQDRAYRLRKFERSNNGTCINQRPIVKRGETVAFVGPSGAGKRRECRQQTSEKACPPRPLDLHG